MESFLGKWKQNKEKNEGFTKEIAEKMGLSEETFNQYDKVEFTLEIAKADAGGYKYIYQLEGIPEAAEEGPFELGKDWEYADNFEKRTTLNNINVVDGKIVEKQTVKDKPEFSWVTTRTIPDGTNMIQETTAGGLSAKVYLTKV